MMTAGTTHGGLPVPCLLRWAKKVVSHERQDEVDELDLSPGGHVVTILRLHKDRLALSE